MRAKGPTDAARRASARTRKAQAAAWATDVVPLVIQLREQGITSAGGLAKALTARGVPTAQGGTKWQAVQVQRVLARIGA